MKNIYKALANFQQEVPVIHKGTTGYGYSYADLPAIFGVINPLLKKNGLGFSQLIEGSDIKTILFHCESGETIETITEIPKDVILKGMNSFQISGSAFTYFRRYALSSMLGLVTDKDNDASDVKPQGQVTQLKAPVKPVKPVELVKKHITDEQFEKAKGLTEKQLKTVFDKYLFKDKAQEEELTEIYINLKNQ